MVPDPHPTAYQPADRRAACAVSAAIEGCVPPAQWCSTGVLVAVSGGADSLVLAHATCRVARDWASEKKARCAPVCLLHVNHALRGEESDRAARLVSRLAEAWGSESEILPGLLPVERRGLPREGTLRDIRYRLMAEAAERRGIRTVLTAHHADDLAETLLFRMARGTGVAGLAGIPRFRELAPGITLVRPLLELTRQQLRKYAARHGIPFEEDSSNRELTPARNWIRHELMPQLDGRFGPDTSSRIAGLAEEARDVAALLKGLARRLELQADLQSNGNRFRFNSIPLRSADALVIRTMLAGQWQNLGWPEREMSRGLWRRLIAFLTATDGRDRRLDLPGRIRVSLDRDGRAELERFAPSADRG